MTELETLMRAKMYVDKLANGVNPLTDEPVLESDVVNNVRISRCLFYVSSVLSKVIDKNQVRKLTDKFTEDTEFREFVSKYMSTFEDLLARAEQTERSDVLTTVLLGSEAGHLYTLLFKIFSHEA